MRVGWGRSRARATDDPSTGRTLRRVGAQLRIDVRGGTLAEVQVNVCHVHGAVIIQVIAVLV